MMQSLKKNLLSNFYYSNQALEKYLEETDNLFLSVNIIS